MITAKFVKPRVFPWNSVRVPEQVDRLQNISGDLTLNREELWEIGREDRLGFRKQTPSLSFSATQFEYGNMKFWYDLANKKDPQSGEDHYIDLDDLTTTRCELAAFLTDESDVFAGTIYLPNLRVNGFSINIGDPDAIVERSFDLVSEKYRIIEDNYLAYDSIIADGIGNKVITLDPVAIEYATDKYIYRVLRVRAGAVTNLEEGTGDNEWSYAAGDVTVRTCEVGDLIKVFYAAATAYTDLWTDNDDDDTALLADYCEIYMKVGTQTKIYRLQTVGIDVSFERTDYKEIGNNEVVQTGVTSKSVTVSLNRFGENFTLEQILASDGILPDIDPEEFSENIKLLVKIFDDKEHTTLLIGYLMTGLTPSTLGFTQAIQANMENTNALIGTNLKISDLESELTM